MDRFQAMRLFTRIVELGSFSRAAEQLDLNRASATQSIKQLEAHLGVRLLQRTTRQVSTTVDGAAYYQRCLAILNDLEEAESEFSRSARDPQGKIRVDLSGSLCRLLLIPALPEFCERYPLIRLEFSISDKQIDLVREGVDCVLRFGELRDSPLVARRLASLRQVSCASRAYLARHGHPMSLGDLEAHRAVAYISANSGKSLPLEFRTGNGIETRNPPATLSVNDAGAYVAACEAGFGIIQVPSYHVERQLKAGTLVEILPEMPPPALPLAALYPQNRQLSPRVRLFIDWLFELFSSQPEIRLVSPPAGNP